MSKYVFTLFILTVMFLLPRNVMAQEFNQALNTYSLTLEKYNSSHEEYNRTRTQYLNLQTLTAKNEAKEATRQMLSDRDQVFIDYFSLLKAKIDANRGMKPEKKDALKIELKLESDWFANHQSNLVGAGSLEDLVIDSKEAEKRWNDSKDLIYKVLSEISLGEVDGFENRLGESFDEISKKVESIRNEERHEYILDTRKLERIDRWLFETRGRMDRGVAKKDAVLGLILSIGEDRRTEGISVFPQVVSRLSVAVQDYQEASLFLKEIVEEVKTK